MDTDMYECVCVDLFAGIEEEVMVLACRAVLAVPPQAWDEVRGFPRERTALSIFEFDESIGERLVEHR
jgi:hypothetical protein